MGMYTELIFGAKLKKDTPKEIINTILHLLAESKMENPLFKTEYYESSFGFLNGGSYYFAINKSVNKFWYDGISKSWHLSSRSNQKNYESDIKRFLDWIKPYIDYGSGGRDMYAIVIYEEQDNPDIYYLN